MKTITKDMCRLMLEMSTDKNFFMLCRQAAQKIITERAPYPMKGDNEVKMTINLINFSSGMVPLVLGEIAARATDEE